ncbi:hypothetical protein Cyast_0865 [Cyanobacterium stanieri PCC 7202]|uniref:Uncharacterized protein n=1 Tax=Cyanobacterium stanieri (strain ATCC 29140 / PCC 7202) TaxID=292563 RepID=K9YK37_CYASC|nr:hypothetical protein Cyast_0865 [Cyanobacterium stanieri PCC 7202]
MSSSQWERLLKNRGVWLGSFTQFSPRGELIKDTPTRIQLEGLHEDKTIRLTVTRLGQDTPPHVNEFTYLNRSIFLFEEGHFSKGTLQFSPFSTFGAEFGFVKGDSEGICCASRRLRMVQLFDKDSNFEQATLIREFREGTPKKEREKLSLDQLIGKWQGEAVTLYPDWREPEKYPTQLILEQMGDRLKQTLKTPQLEFNSSAIIENNALTFPDSNIRTVLLPDGASLTVPLKIIHRQPFFLECGWLIEPNQRLRIIRNYDETGAWQSVTLVTEFKQP